MDVERAGLVMLVELLIARFVHFTVEHALVDEELRPLEVAVAGEQGIVEIEQGKAHRVPLQGERNSSKGPTSAHVAPARHDSRAANAEAGRRSGRWARSCTK